MQLKIVCCYSTLIRVIIFRKKSPKISTFIMFSDRRQNSMKLCTNPTEIFRSNIGIINFRFSFLKCSRYSYHNYRKMSLPQSKKFCILNMWFDINLLMRMSSGEHKFRLNKSKLFLGSARRWSRTTSILVYEIILYLSVGNRGYKASVVCYISFCVKKLFQVCTYQYNNTLLTNHKS